MSTPYIRVIASLALALVTFSGRLLDQTTGQPLAGVHVRASGASSRSATTSALGRFTLSAMKPGTYTISVQSDDVPPQRFHVKLRGSRTTLTMRACSTTLDYHCGTPQQGGGPG